MNPVINIKVEYLHQKQKYFLLYKYQPEILDYLIQSDGGHSDYKPIELSVQAPNGDNTPQTSNEIETNNAKTEKPRNHVHAS